MRAELFEKDYRTEFVAETVRNRIAYQIRALRQQREWSQAELGKRSGKAQNVISRLENPDYGSLTVTTLLDVAAAFDVGLIVSFAPFKKVLAQLTDVSPKALFVASFKEEVKGEQLEGQGEFQAKGNLEHRESLAFLYQASGASKFASASHLTRSDMLRGASAAQIPTGQSRRGGGAAAAAA